MGKVSSSYLSALVDERQILKRAIADNESDLTGFCREMLASAKRCRAQGWSGEMADYMRGSVDFWRNQVKIREGRK